jgi:signal transduction histidine kinase
VSDEHALAAGALLDAVAPGSVLLTAVFDEQLRCLAVSPSLADPADAVGRPAAEVLPAPVAPTLVAAFEALRAEGGSSWRRPLITPPGADTPLYRVGCYRLDGAEPRFAFLGADITARSERQMRVRENRRRLELAERVAGIGAYTWWPAEGDRWSWSPQLLELAGFADHASAPPYASWIARVDPRDRKLTVDARDRTARGERIDITIRQQRAPGDHRVLRVIAVPSVGAAGDVERVDGVVQDITDFERTAAQHRAVAELGRTALEHLDVGELIRRAREAVTASLDLPGVAILEYPAAPVPPGAESVPIPGPEGAWGAIVVSGRALTDEELQFLHAVANVLGNAIARLHLESELSSQARARGRLLAEALDAEDRTRREISETLHDGPLQDLLALTQYVDQLDTSGERSALHLERARAGLRQAITGLREVMVELHPVVLDVGGLESALGAVAAQQGRIGGFEADVRIEEAACGLRDALVLSLARELLVNAAKHARATRVGVSVARTDGELRLEVADDGAGIADGRLADAVRDGHIGLASTRQRVEAVGGWLRIASTLGAGTTITAGVPA